MSMRCRLAWLLLLAVLAPGCTALPAARPVRPVRVEADRVLALAASQVRRCYRSPQVSFEGRQIVTRLRVRFTGDGQLAQLPVVIAQHGVTPRNEPYAGRMAEAAIAAVLRCAPLRLPEGSPANRAYAFDLTFSPLAPA
jgi:hypothetical protein